MLIRTILATTLIAAVAIASTPVSAADAVKGKKVYNKCRACHTSNKGGKNRIGPNLFGIFGKAAGVAKGYKYSASYLKAGKNGLKWNAENLEGYLTNPRKFMRKTTGDKSAKTKMVLRLRKKSERENVVEYLKTLK